MTAVEKSVCQKKVQVVEEGWIHLPASLEISVLDFPMGIKDKEKWLKELTLLWISLCHLKNCMLETLLKYEISKISN